MTFDRFDICAAHNLYAHDYGDYERKARLDSMRYKAAASEEFLDGLSENAREIYLRLVEATGHALIAVDTDPSYAPCSYLICRVIDGDWNTRDEENTVLVQTDWDLPGLASSFGWVPCECGATDGTIDCSHKTATEMISEAAEFLDEIQGQIIPDPGYFG